MYQKRLIDEKIKEYFSEMPALLIEGAKAVGKTKTAMNFSKTIYHLDDESALELLESNPAQILKDAKPVLVDEWQFSPQIWTYIRHAVDDGLPDGSVILTGSSLNVNSKIHSGAGRIIRFKMRTFTVEESGLSEDYIRISELFDFGKNDKVVGKTNLLLADYLDEIFKSGFPGIRSRSEKIRKQMLDGYVQNIVYREFEENGFQIKKPEALLSWLQTYAAAVATTTAFQTIVDTAMANNVEAPSKPTANNYKEVLSTLNIIGDVPAWLPMGKLFPNLGKTPKHFLLDTALVVTLLSVSKEELTKYQVPKPIGKFNKTFVGQLFESYVYQSLVVYADVNDAELRHLRLNKGEREIDFILQKGKKLIAIEVKSQVTASDEDVKHLNWFEEKVSDEYKVVKILINAGKQAYTRKDGVHIVPIGLLGS